MLTSEKIVQRIIRQLDQIGISSKVGGSDSHTAELVRLIVQEIITSIKTDAIVDTVVQTSGSAYQHTGYGKGKIK